MEFYEFAIESEGLKHNERISKAGIFDTFRDEYPDTKKWLGQKTFIKFIKNYAKFVNCEYLEGNSNFRWIEIVDNNKPVEEKTPF